MMQYQVQNGDTLSKIADFLLGDETRWREIATLNKLTDPNKIYVGQILTLPDIVSSPGSVTSAPVAKVPSTSPTLKTPGIFSGIDFKKPILGIPLYIWLIGAGALVVVPFIMPKRRR